MITNDEFKQFCSFLKFVVEREREDEEKNDFNEQKRKKKEEKPFLLVFVEEKIHTGNR